MMIPGTTTKILPKESAGQGYFILRGHDRKSCCFVVQIIAARYMKRLKANLAWVKQKCKTDYY
jgi:hypothetical protein